MPCLVLASSQALHALSASASRMAAVLRQEAARGAAATAPAEDAKAAAGENFDEARKGGSFFSVTVLEPVGYVDAPGAPPVPVPEDPVAKGPGLADSYHAVGTRPFPGLTVYKMVPDVPGRDNATSKPGSDWRSWAPTAMLAVGIAATIGGLFFPPLLFLGGLLLGGWGALKLMSAKA